MTSKAVGQLADPLHRVAAPLRSQVIGLMRESICKGEFPPGERLVEKTLCERYAVSRTVVREALRHLEAEGLVDLVAHRGPVVRVLSERDADSLYEVRGALEGLAGQLFAERATAAQREELIRAVAQVRAVVEHGTLPDLLAAKTAFYDALLGGSGNPVIRETLRTVRTQIGMLRGVSLQAKGRLPLMLDELEAIVDAAAVRRDPEAARTACVAHVAAASAAMRRVRDERRAAGG